MKLGLDKLIKPEETKTIKKKEDDTQVKKSDSKHKDNRMEIKLSKLKKFNLTCSNAKSKYKKSIVKKALTEKDKICPRCKKEMKIK